MPKTDTQISALLTTYLAPGNAAWATIARRYKGKLRFAFVARQLNGAFVKGHALTVREAERLATEYAERER